jgi:hypothetical protein
LNNLGAKWICQNMGVETDFMRLLPVLMVRQSDWRKLPKVELKVAYKDFAHSHKSCCDYQSGKGTIPRSNLGSLFRVTHV